MRTDSFCVEQAIVEFQRGPVNVAAAFDLALHTGKPTTDAQSSKEVDLDGYGRVAVMRSEQAWVVRGREITNGETVKFPTITRGSGKVTHLSIGIGGKIRRIVTLQEPVELKANRRVEFEPGVIKIIEKE